MTTDHTIDYANDTIREGGNRLTVRGPTSDGGWWVHSTRDGGLSPDLPYVFRSPEAASRAMRGGCFDDRDVLRRV